MLRSKHLVVIAASCFAMFQGDFASAEPAPTSAHAKSGGSAQAAERTKPGAATKPAAANRTAQPPAAPTVKTVSVCVRPDGVDKSVKSWTYNETYKLVLTDVESTARRLGNWIYVFDEKASLDSPGSLPTPDNKKKCPNDKRNAAPAAPQPPKKIQSILAPGSIVKGPLPDRVRIFCDWAGRYDPPDTDAGRQARAFANNLRTAIVDDKPVGIVLSNELSLEAAGLLSGFFNEKIVSALIYKQVIAPKDVQQVFMASVSSPEGKRFQLIGDQWVHSSRLGTTDTTPTVILKHVIHEAVSTSLDAQMANVKSLVEAKEAYGTAYADVPAWLQAIGPYFEEKHEPPAQQEVTASATATATATKDDAEN